MKPFLWFLAILLLIIIQAGILIPLNLTAANLVLIFLVSAVLLSDFDQALALTLVSGLLLDFLSGLPDGVIMISLFAIFLILYFVVNTVLEREPNQIVLFTSVAAATIGFYLLIFVLRGLRDPAFLLLNQLPKALVLNLIFTFPVFRYYSKINQWLTHLKLKV